MGSFGILTGYKRLNNSVNGNPRFELYFEYEFPRITQSDAGCCFENTLRLLKSGDRIPVLFRTTRAGRVWDLEPYSESEGL
jgi:hypothetical protein